MVDDTAPFVGHLRRNGWTRISRVVYLPRSMADSLVCRAQAWRMVLPHCAVITHLSAAALRGWWLPRGLPADPPFFVSVPKEQARPRRIGLRVVRQHPAPASSRYRGLPVALPAETLLACARDLAMLDLVDLIDSALQATDCSMPELIEVASQPRRGAPRLRDALRFADGRSESPYESLLRVLHAVCDVPVESQEVIRDEAGRVVARADLRIKGTPRLPEYDGSHHRDAVQYERDRARTKVCEPLVGSRTPIRRSRSSRNRVSSCATPMRHSIVLMIQHAYAGGKVSGQSQATPIRGEGGSGVTWDEP